MKEKIERERKKKSLLQQIQNEIGRIKGSSKEDENEDIVDDETPAWLKLVMHSQNKKLSSTTKKELEPKLEPKVVHSQTEERKQDDSEAFETPTWIKIFQERSEKLSKARQEMKNETKYDKTSFTFPCDDQEHEEDENKEDANKAQTLAPKIYMNIDYDEAIAKNEAIVQKSVKDLKLQLTNQKQVDTVKKRQTNIVIDRVRKVKSLFINGEPEKDKDLKNQKDKDLKVS